MPVLDFHDAGHRDDDVEVGMTLEHLRGGGPHTCPVGGVDLDRVDIGVFRGDLLEQFRPPAPDDHGVAFVA